MTDKSAAAVREFTEKYGLNWRSDNLLSDLTALIEEHYYPKEFVEWLSFGSHPFVSWFDEEGHYYTDELSDKRWSIDELYQYWRETEQ